MKTGILYLIDTLETVGGTERHLFELVKRLKNTAYQPFVCSLGREGIFSRQFGDEGIDIENLAIKRVYGLNGLRAFFCLKDKIRKNEIRIIHAFHFGAQLLATALAKASKTPLVLSVRDLGFWKKAHHEFITRQIDGLADKVLVNSQAIKKDLMSKGLAEDKISVIYNGVDFEKFQKNYNAAAYRQELGITQQRHVIAYIGWLRPEKGVNYFIESARKVLSSCSEPQFLVIGDGPLRKALEDQAKDLGIKDKVSFLGDRKDIPQLLSLVDVCVLPSLTEGFSNTVLEAMAASVPVVASRVGGNPEAVKDGETGLLVPLGDADALAAAIARLLEDEPLRKMMGQKAQQRARAEFDIAQTVRQYEQLYDEVLARGK